MLVITGFCPYYINERQFVLRTWFSANFGPVKLWSLKGLLLAVYNIPEASGKNEYNLELQSIVFPSFQLLEARLKLNMDPFQVI